MHLSIGKWSMRAALAALCMTPGAAAAADRFQNACKAAGGSYITPNYVQNLSMVAQVGPYVRPAVTFQVGTNHVTGDIQDVGSQAFDILHTAFLYRRKVAVCIKDVDFDPSTDINLLVGIEIEASAPSSPAEDSPAAN